MRTTYAPPERVVLTMEECHAIADDLRFELPIGGNFDVFSIDALKESAADFRRLIPRIEHLESVDEGAELTVTDPDALRWLARRVARTTRDHAQDGIDGRDTDYARIWTSLENKFGLDRRTILTADVADIIGAELRV